MSVHLTPSVEALLSEPVLSSKLGLVLAVAALAAVVVLQAARTLAAEHPVSNALASLTPSPTSTARSCGRGGRHGLWQLHWGPWGHRSAPCRSRNEADCGAGGCGRCGAGGQEAADLLADVGGCCQGHGHPIRRRPRSFSFGRTVDQLVVRVLWGPASPSVFACEKNQRLNFNE